MFSDKTKRLIGEVSVCAVALAIVLVILIPTISKCIENGEENKCRKNLELITNSLNTVLNDDKDSEKWVGLISQKNSRQLIDALKLTMEAKDANKIVSSEYYTKIQDGELQIHCRKHDKIDDYSVKLPLGLPEAAIKQDEPINHIQVIGIRTYMQNEAINPDKPEQMQFTSEDDLKKIFSDLEVSAVYIGGEKKLLNDYKISTDGFDMSVPGTKTIKIEYAGDKTWNKTKYAKFDFYVMQKTACPPLVIKFNDGAEYELAAWDWTDYVAEAGQNAGASKNFDASIVYFDEKYYYYPDGFNIDSRRDNTSPDTSAADIDDPTVAAYRIEFKPEVIISSKDDKEEMKKAVDGALMLEENQVYIWQTEPSKELDSGWIRVFCEMKKK